MGTISLSIPQIGQPDTTEDVKIQNNFTTLQTVINGNLDTNNLSPTAAITATQVAAALAQSASVNQSGQTVKGAVNIATSQSTSSTTYTTLATPDQVTGIVLPANGLLAVWYWATWSATNTANAAIFLNSNQAQIAAQTTAPATQSAAIGNANIARPLATSYQGLNSDSYVQIYTSDVTTGQILGSGNASGIGGPVYLFAAAGTYTVSVQFKVGSGTVTAANRKLWVQALSFA